MISYFYPWLFLYLFCMATAFVVPSFRFTPRGSVARGSAGPTTVLGLTPPDKTDALADKLDKLVGELMFNNSFLLSKIDVLTGQVVDLMGNNTVMAGQIGALTVDVGALKAESLALRRLNCAKDYRDFVLVKDETIADADQAKMKEMSETRNTVVHFIRTKFRIKGPADLLTYDPTVSPSVDSQALVCGKLWVYRGLLEKGLPEVR